MWTNKQTNKQFIILLLWLWILKRFRCWPSSLKSITMITVWWIVCLFVSLSFLYKILFWYLIKNYYWILLNFERINLWLKQQQQSKATYGYVSLWICSYNWGKILQTATFWTFILTFFSLFQVKGNVSYLKAVWGTHMKKQGRRFDWENFQNKTLYRIFSFMLRGGKLDDSQQRE